jgi:hypothetical protein
MMFVTLPVLAYQLFFVAVLYVASRFGRTPLNVAMVVCLIWTATHIFLLPLAVLQATVIIASYFVFRRKHLPIGAASK